jgi:hypothetical protein
MGIADVITVLESAERLGAAEDVPEGSRVIQLSETLVNQMLDALRNERQPGGGKAHTA